MSDQLRKAIANAAVPLLRERGPMAAQAIAAALHASFPDLHPVAGSRQVAVALSHDGRFAHDGGTPSLWRIGTGTSMDERVDLARRRLRMAVAVRQRSDDPSLAILGIGHLGSGVIQAVAVLTKPQVATLRDELSAIHAAMPDHESLTVANGLATMSVAGRSALENAVS